MSYFICDNCDKRHDIFGEGARRRIVEQFGIQNAIEIPMVGAIAKWSDAGTPVVAAEKESRPAQLYRELSAAVVREISKLTVGEQRHAEVTYDPARGVVFTPATGEPIVLHPARLRRACRCAHCVDEMTGTPRLDPQSVPDNVEPTRLESMGNYAVSIGWSDQHNSIYPFEALAKLGA
jgi:DUF971 family protein